MSTLLLRLSGPLQSWGISSKFNRRTTGMEPSKSGVIGMLAAALGRSRDSPVDDIASLRFGVRVDQKGTVVRDYHTVHKWGVEKMSYITNRYYLADATFLVGLEGDRNLLEKLDNAVRNPTYPLYLGRRSCPPAGRLSLGISDTTLEEALSNTPWLASEWFARRQPPEVYLDLILDAADGAKGYLQRDYPLSFSQVERSFTVRSVEYRPMAVMITNELGKSFKMNATEHDPFSQLRGV